MVALLSFKKKEAVARSRPRVLFSPTAVHHQLGHAGRYFASPAIAFKSLHPLLHEHSLFSPSPQSLLM